MAEEHRSYFDRLKFDPKLFSSWHAKYIQNIRLVILLILTIVAVGVTSLLSLPRRLNPEVKLTIVTIITVLPGANPGDVESLVTVPLEDKLQGQNGLDTIVSVSRESVSAITLQYKSGVDKDKARTDAQTAVSELTSLPSDAQTPKVTALDFENQPIWTFALSTDEDIASLMRYSDTLKKKIEDVPNVDHVALAGTETQEIQVVLDPAKVREYNLNPMQVSQAVKAAANSYPAGSVDSDTSTFALSIDAQATTIDEIRNIRLTVAGQPVKLGDIASVSERAKPGMMKTYYASEKTPGRRTVSFSVFKTSSADIDKTVAAVEKFVQDELKNTGGRYSLLTINNAGEEISKQFTDLVGEFQSTIILVFFDLLLFLGVRQALIACMTIPLTFLMSFAWMNLLGQSVNFITMFSLLLAFGTSIDDTIVTVSAMTAYFRTGKFTPIETGLLVWRDIVVPIWTTTVTTVWAFLPLLLTSGILGEFIKPIPTVVATTMYTSTAVAWFITLPMIIVLLKLNVPRRVVILARVLGSLAAFILLVTLIPKTLLFIPTLVVAILLVVVVLKVRPALAVRFITPWAEHPANQRMGRLAKRIISTGLIDTAVLGRKYELLISRIIASGRGRRIALTAIVCFAISSYLMVPTGLVKNEFFPKTNADTVYVTLELPSGTNATVLEREAGEIMETLRHTPETLAVVTETGESIGSNFAASVSDNSALFTLTLVPKERRRRESSVIAAGIRKQFEHYAKGKVSVVELSSGPPVGADVQIKLTGDDLSVLDTYADKTIAYLSRQHGVINADKTVKPGTGKLVFVPDKDKMAAAGVDLGSTGLWLRLSASGFTLDKVKFGHGDEEDVTFYTNDGTLHPEDLAAVTIPTQSGTSIPLMSLGNVRLETNPTVIYREGGKRTISVVAGVLPGYSVSDINKNLQAYADDGLRLPPGYTWSTGGANEENAKSVQSILRAMGLSFILIMATMVIEFSSYRQAAMILSLIPLAVSGVFIIFGLTGTPLSFPALIGVMALFGVVVTNAMFIVEKINQNRKEGMHLVAAIADAGRSRLEPILLTSLTSILGLVPITLSNPLWRGLGGAIIAGLMFSGIIMLVYIPVIYYTVYRGTEKAG